jgi:hypothetical protein
LSNNNIHPEQYSCQNRLYCKIIIHHFFENIYCVKIIVNYHNIFNPIKTLLKFGHLFLQLYVTIKITTLINNLPFMVLVFDRMFNYNFTHINIIQSHSTDLANLKFKFILKCIFSLLLFIYNILYFCNLC